MYEVDDSGQGDYALAPTVPGFDENESVTVIDLQDSDLERGSLEDVAVALETAMNDLCTLIDFRAKLATEDAKHKPEILKAARRARLSMEKRYGMRSKFTVESLHVSNVVMALEEEAEEESGIFMRMIKAIGRAFKWLWEKVTEFLFGKKKDKSEQEIEAQEKKNKVKIKAYEEKLESGAKVDAAKEFGNDAIRKAFGHLGDHVTCDMILTMTEANLRNAEALTATIKAAAENYRRMVNISSHESALAEDIHEMTKINATSFTVGAMSMMKRFGREDHKRLGIQEHESDDFSEVVGLKNFVGGAEFIAWRQKHGGHISWVAEFVKPEAKSCKLERGHPPALYNLSSLASELEKKVSTSKTNIENDVINASKAANSDELTKNLEKLLTAATSPEEKADLKKAMVEMKEVGSRVSKMVIASCRALDAITECSRADIDYIMESTAADFMEPSKPAAEPAAS